MVAMLQIRRVLLLAGALVGGGVGRALAKVHVLDDDSFDGFVDHLAEDTLLLVDFFSVRQHCRCSSSSSSSARVFVPFC